MSSFPIFWYTMVPILLSRLRTIIGNSRLTLIHGFSAYSNW